MIKDAVKNQKEKTYDVDNFAQLYLYISGHVYSNVMLQLCNFWVENMLFDTDDGEKISNEYVRKNFLFPFALSKEPKNVNTLKLFNENLSLEVIRKIKKAEQDAKNNSNNNIADHNANKIEDNANNIADINANKNDDNANKIDDNANKHDDNAEEARNKRSDPK